jgi:hypothetical protein
VNNAKHRATIHSLFAIVGLLRGLTVLVLVAVHVRAARSDIRTLNQECSDEASAFRSEADNLAAGSKVVGYASHYNRQRHQCFVKITSKRPEDGGTSATEQIFDPNDGTFGASCDRLSGVRSSSTIVMGAPTPVQKETAAQA